MAWQLSGELYETCSCKMLCPCIFGPAEPDQGWCSGALLFDVQQGNSDGVDLAGSRAVLVFDLPGDFVSGNFTTRLYLSDAASAEQRRELEAIIGGQKGGAFGGLAGMISKALPTQTTSISVTGGDNPSVTVGDVGRISLARLKSGSGKPTTITNAMVTESFGVSAEELARGDGSQWSDPDMRSWRSGGSGGVGRFSLSA
jgi:hypothetical protein